MSVPPRWRHCPRKGKVVANKFLPFKTPLSAEYDKNLLEEQYFHPSMLIAYTESITDHRMGLVIDLTKTNRYYDKRELMNCGIAHHKMVCEGYGAAPDNEQVSTFITICKKYFDGQPDDIVGVHCTHGFNRTGFLIAAYLMEVEFWEFEAAVATFASARPPGIYKEHYLQELATRYNGGDIQDVRAPTLPDWCYEEEEVNSGDEGGGEEGEKEKEKKKYRRIEHNDEHAQFAVPIEGVLLVGGSLRTEIQTACQHILGWESGGFPGGQPVSMDVQNIRHLNEDPYRVSWKADGTRYILYIKDRGQIYLINRDNSVFSSPNVSFLSRKRQGDHLKDCLADSELVIDTINGVERPRLLIYDVMMFEGSTDVSLCDHMRRMVCIDRELVQPRDEAIRKGLVDKGKEPFSVRAKQFWDISETRMVLETFIPQLSHENDGLIFNPLKQPCKTGQCDEVLKWKPPELNSVDFRLNIVTEQKQGMLKEKVGQLLVGSGSRTVMLSQLDFKLNKEAKEMHNKIIECSFVDNKWKFLRIRNDKSFPNSYDTAKSVCQSIRQPVTKEWLLKVCEEYRWTPEKAGKVAIKRTATEETDMPPPKKAPREITTPMTTPIT